MVFCILSLVTTPIRSLRIFFLSLERVELRDLAAQPLEEVRLVELSGDLLLPQCVQLLVERVALLLKFRDAQVSQFPCLRDRHKVFLVMNRVLGGTFADASLIDSLANSSGKPSTSKSIFPRWITATQDSTMPLPLPMRVSAGFFVTGLSGNARMNTLPSVTLREMATRAASIWTFVNQPFSSACRPNSPNDSVLPRCAAPLRRPRWALRYLTRLGLNSMWRGLHGRRGGAQVGVFLDDIALVNQHLYPDLAVGRLRLMEAVIDVGPQGMERHLALVVTLGARDLGAGQAALRLDLDALGAGVHRLLHGLLHGPAERNALFELQRDVLGDQLRLGRRILDLADVDVHFLVAGDALQFLAQTVDVRALAADDHAGARRVDVDPDLVARALDPDARDRGLREGLQHVLADL